MLLAPLLLQVVLVIPRGALSPAVVAAGVAEAAAIWRPYGVVVDISGGCPAATESGERLTVSIVSRPLDRRHAAWQPPLAAVEFIGGVPQPVISVFLTELIRIVKATRAFAVAESVWPSTMREQVLGRAFGRVVAHEIGHYLLQDPRHTPNGLMRALQTGDDLASPARNRLELSKESVARLALGGNGLTQKGPAAAGPSSAIVK